MTLHVPKADRLGHPANIAEVKEIRRKYPGVKLVIAHLGRCYTMPHAQEAFPHFADDEGLYFDSSAVLNADVHRLALETFGPKRILYGSDNPVFYMRGRRLFSGRQYINHTDYPFHFNRDRESPEIEANYTLYHVRRVVGDSPGLRGDWLKSRRYRGDFFRECPTTDWLLTLIFFAFFARESNKISGGDLFRPPSLAKMHSEIVF